jgi:hypothetical protein
MFRDWAAQKGSGRRRVLRSEKIQGKRWESGIVPLFALCGTFFAAKWFMSLSKKLP